MKRRMERGGAERERVSEWRREGGRDGEEEEEDDEDDDEDDDGANDGEGVGFVVDERIAYERRGEERGRERERWLSHHVVTPSGRAVSELNSAPSTLFLSSPLSSSSSASFFVSVSTSTGC